MHKLPLGCSKIKRKLNIDGENKFGCLMLFDELCITGSYAFSVCLYLTMVNQHDLSQINMTVPAEFIACTSTVRSSGNQF